MLNTKIKYATLLFLVMGQSSFADFFGSGANQFSMEFVQIGNPGNAADSTSSPSFAGAVNYNYRLGKFEVSRDMVIKANNLAGLGITLGNMSAFGGNGLARPATEVSWNEAARFVNWLNTSTGGFAAYKFATSGANTNITLWTPTDTLDYDSSNPFRSRRANYVIPSMDEWYKAAYYDPTTGSYSDYPNGLNVHPTEVASGTAMNTAVFSLSVSLIGPADIHLAGGLSPYGIMGLGGNVYEWQETESDLLNNQPSFARLVRGGNWANSVSTLSSTFSQNFVPTFEDIGIGFRVASLLAVPEPLSLALCGVGLGGVILPRRRTIRS